MKLNRTLFYIAALICLPLVATAHSPLQAVEREVNRAIFNTKSPKYYVPLVQLSEEKPAPSADGTQAGIFYVEIGLEYTYDGTEPILWSITSPKEVTQTADGPEGPFVEEINPVIFNEAYRRFAMDPRSCRSTIEKTKKLLTKYYRQVEAEKLAEAQKESK